MFFLKNFLQIRLFAAGTALMLLLTGGCSSAPPETVHSQLPSGPYTGERSQELAALLQPLALRGTAMPLPPVLTEEKAAAMIDAVRACGFNRLYLTVGNLADFEGGSDTPLRLLLKAAAANGVQVELVMRQSFFVRQFRGNTFRRFFLSETPNLPEAAKCAADFIAGLPEEERPCGVVAAIEPHLFVSANIRRPQGEFFAWSENTYGPGLDNDMLMRKSLEALKAVHEALAPLPVTAGFADFYQEKTQTGKLSCGSVGDFQKITPQILVYNSGNKPSETVSVVAEELAAAAGEKSMLVGISIAPHTAVSSGALRRRNWADLTRALGYAIENWSAAPAFRGVVIGPFYLIRQLQAEE